MTKEEFQGIQQIVQRYNQVFIEADILRYENRIFQKELLVAYQEIAELKSRLDETTEDLSKIIPQVFEPQVTVDPLPVEVEIFKEMPEEAEEVQIILVSQEEAKEAVKEAILRQAGDAALQSINIPQEKKYKKRVRKPKSSNVVAIDKKKKTGGDIPF
jgi:hypothetical protein